MKNAISPNTSMDGVELKPPNMMNLYIIITHLVSPSSFSLASET